VAQDFAKKGGKTGAGKGPARKKQTGRHPSEQRARGGGWRLYFAGVASGVFLSFLAYLGTLPGPGGPAHVQQAGTEQEEPIPKPQFEFYNLLPKLTIDTELEPAGVEPAADVRKPEAAVLQDVYLLQAGSFRQREDADQRRAELLLLGLEPSVEEAVSDTGRWFRVYLGPFETRADMSRARGLTANQNIDTLLLKRGNP
jgi:hypothetical protein